MKLYRLFKVDYILHIGCNPQFNTPKENAIDITQVKYNTEDGYGLNSYMLLCPLTRKFSPFSITKKYFSQTQKLHVKNRKEKGVKHLTKWTSEGNLTKVSQRMKE